MLELPASNIACRFYSNLNEEEDNYSLIKIKIVLSNGQSYEYSSSAADLKEMDGLTQILQRFSQKVKTQDFVGLISEFETSIDSNLTSEQLKKYCIPYDSAYGHIKQTQFQGFSYFKSEKDNKALAHLSVIMIREKGNNPVSLFIDRKTKKILTMKYEF